MKKNSSIIWAILAAALYAFSSPLSKLLLKEIPATLMAALLYLGAGIGMSLLGLFRYQFKLYRKDKKPREELNLTKKELPFVFGMIVLDIAAPIFLMMGLKSVSPASVSLLNNFEIVATSLIAFLLFKETIKKKLWAGIGFITLASMILSVEDISTISFSYGSLFILLACICWGFENNCTRMLSVKDPLQIVILKGFGSGLGALLIAILAHETSSNIKYIMAALLLGFLAYGLSIYFYVYAQRTLGAAKTSAYYALSPFIGAVMSFLLFPQLPSFSFILALFIMIAGTWLVSIE